ncbi:MAG: hypothetical protein HY680_03615 [Chloroflexi bacterium]|nr:hypothetical protein [Chloroflexota bacterium]
MRTVSPRQPLAKFNVGDSGNRYLTANLDNQGTALSTVNALVDILVSFDTTSAGQALPRSINAGQTIQALLVIDATQAINTQADVQGILSSTATPS